jgi:hypothetical protein
MDMEESMSRGKELSTDMREIVVQLKQHFDNEKKSAPSVSTRDAFGRTATALDIGVTTEPPHKLEKKAFNAKKFSHHISKLSQNNRKMLHIAKNGDNLRIFETPLPQSFVLLLKSSI